MSLVKKLNNEIYDWNSSINDIRIYNSVLFHWYKILDKKTNKCKFFYYNDKISYKENINNLKLKITELYSELHFYAIKNCYYDKKFIDMKEYEECSKRCFYKPFCESEVIK